MAVWKPKDGQCFQINHEFFSPFVIRVPGGNEEKEFQGICKEILNIFAEKHNFCYNSTRDESKLFGIKNPNGGWIGFIDKLINGSIAFGTVGALTPEYNEVIDLSYPVFMDDTLIFYKEPQVQPDVLNFLKPFSSAIWSLILFLTLIVASIMSVFFAYNKWNKKKEERILDNFYKSFSFGAMMTYAIIMSQTLKFRIRGTYLYTLIAVWTLFALIMTTIYKSTLKATLIVPKIVIPFDSLEEMIEQNKIPFKMPGKTAIDEAFKNSPPGSTFRKAYDRMMGFDNNEQVIMRDVAEGKYAYIHLKSGAMNLISTYYNQTGICNAHITKHAFLTGYMISFFTFPKGAPLYKQFNKELLRLYEFGIIKHIIKKQIQKGIDCLKKVKQERRDIKERPLALGDYYGVFALFGIGILFSFMAFCAEILVARNQHT